MNRRMPTASITYGLNNMEKILTLHRVNETVRCLKLKYIEFEINTNRHRPWPDGMIRTKKTL